MNIWIHLAQNATQGLAIVSTVMTFQVPEYFLTSGEAINAPRKSLFYGIHLCS
jgi:hypothetical protein